MKQNLRVEKRRAESRGCDYQGKATLNTRAIARVVAARCSRLLGVPLRFYKCPGCKRYHLTKRGAE